MTQSLVSSLAFFSALVDKRQSLLQVLADLAEYALLSQRIYIFNSTSATDTINSFYNFDLPTAVIKQTIRYLENESRVSKNNSEYHLCKTSIEAPIQEAYDNSNDALEKIKDQLILFVEKESSSYSSSEESRSKLFDDFLQSILNDTPNSDQSEIITKFIFSLKGNPDVKNSLNSIKTSLVIYKGLQNPVDLSHLGSWTQELHLFFQTEILFSAYGLNGEQRRKLFDEFWNLILEINQSARNNGKKDLIKCFYLPHTKDEIDRFYYSAEQIVAGKAYLDPTKTAMRLIAEGRRNISDIVEHRTRFEGFLQTKGIQLYRETIDTQRYFFESSKILEQLKEESQANNKPFDEEEFLDIFSRLAVVNALREGNSSKRFENCKYFIVSENSLVIHIACNNLVKYSVADTPCAARMDYLTAKFWFNLNKGFGKKSPLLTFDIVLRTQLALGSSLNRAIAEKRKEIIEKIQNGRLSRDDGQQLLFNLRQKTISIEKMLEDENNSADLSFFSLGRYADLIEEDSQKNIIIESLKSANDQLRINYEKSELERERESSRIGELQRVGESQRKHLARLYNKKLIDSKVSNKRRMKLIIFINILLILVLFPFLIFELVPIFNVDLSFLSNIIYIPEWMQGLTIGLAANMLYGCGLLAFCKKIYRQIIKTGEKYYFHRMKKAREKISKEIYGFVGNRSENGEQNAALELHP